MRVMLIYSNRTLLMEPAPLFYSFLPDLPRLSSTAGGASALYGYRGAIRAARENP